MGVLQKAFTAVLMFTAAAGAAAQCVSDVRVISARTSVPNLVAGPVAHGGDLLVTAKFDPAARQIFLAVSDGTLNPVTGDVLATSDSPDGPLALVWNGSGFGLFYRTLSSHRLVLQRLTSAGALLGTPIPVSDRTIDVTEEVDVVWSGRLQAYVIATTYAPRANKDVWVTVMDRDGIVQRDVNTSVFGLHEATWLNVAVTDDGTIGVFYAASDESIVFAHITAAPGAPVDRIWSRGRDLQVVALGNRFHLVKQVQNLDRTEIRWLVVDSSGAAVAPDRLLVAPTGLDVRPLALATNGQELALSYLDAERGFGEAPGVFMIQRFTPAGAVIANSIFAAADPVHGFAYTEHDPVWMNGSWVTGAVRASGRELESLLIRLCPLRARITAPRQYVTSDELVTFTAAAEGGAPDYAYSWSSGNSSTVYRGATFSYRYLHNGTYTVTLTVTDSAGVTATATYDIRVAALKRRAARK